MMYLKNWHFCLSAFLKVDSGWNIDNFMSPFFQYSGKEQWPWTKSCRIFTLMEWKKKKKYFKAPLPSLSLPAFKLFLSDIWFVLISFCFVVAFSCFRGNLINFKMWICYCCFWFWIVFTILYMDLFSKLAVFICYRGRVCERFVLVFLRLSRSYKLKMC